jgi:hypothetical protein
MKADQQRERTDSAQPKRHRKIPHPHGSTSPNGPKALADSTPADHLRCGSEPEPQRLGSDDSSTTDAVCERGMMAHVKPRSQPFQRELPVPRPHSSGEGACVVRRGGLRHRQLVRCLRRRGDAGRARRPQYVSVGGARSGSTVDRDASPEAVVGLRWGRTPLNFRSSDMPIRRHKIIMFAFLW